MWHVFLSGDVEIRKHSLLDSKYDPNMHTFRANLQNVYNFALLSKNLDMSMVDGRIQVAVAAVTIRIKAFTKCAAITFDQAHMEQVGQGSGYGHLRDLRSQAAHMGLYSVWYSYYDYNSPKLDFASRYNGTAHPYSSGSTIAYEYMYAVQQRAHEIENLQRIKAAGHWSLHAYKMGKAHQTSTFMEQLGTDEDGVASYSVNGGLTKNSLISSTMNEDFDTYGEGEHNYIEPPTWEGFMNESDAAPNYKNYFVRPLKLSDAEKEIMGEELTNTTIEYVKYFYEKKYYPNLVKLRNGRQHELDNLIEDDYPGDYRACLRYPIANVLYDDNGRAKTYVVDGVYKEGDLTCVNKDETEDATNIFSVSCQGLANAGYCSYSTAGMWSTGDDGSYEVCKKACTPCTPPVTITEQDIDSVDCVTDAGDAYRAHLLNVHYIDSEDGEYFKLVKTGDTLTATTFEDIKNAYDVVSIPANLSTADDAIYQGGASLSAFFTDCRILLSDKVVASGLIDDVPANVASVGPTSTVKDVANAVAWKYKLVYDTAYLGYHYCAPNLTYFDPNNLAGNTERPSVEWIIANECTSSQGDQPHFEYGLPFSQLYRDIYKIESDGEPILSDGEKVLDFEAFNRIKRDNLGNGERVAQWVKGTMPRGTLYRYKVQRLVQTHTDAIFKNDQMMTDGFVRNREFSIFLSKSFIWISDNIGASFSVSAGETNVTGLFASALNQGLVTQAEVDAFVASEGVHKDGPFSSGTLGSQTVDKEPITQQGILIHEFYVGHSFDFSWELIHPDDGGTSSDNDRGSVVETLDVFGFRRPTGFNSENFNTATNSEGYATFGEYLAFDKNYHMVVDPQTAVPIRDSNGALVQNPMTALLALNDLSRIGARMMVDVAMHSEKYSWSMSRIIRVFYENTLITGADLASFMGRFLISPVQQTTYGGGCILSLGLDSYFKAKLGSDYDRRKFIEDRIGKDDSISFGALVPYYKANYEKYRKDSPPPPLPPSSPPEVSSGSGSD
jgi:hypothetical protein